ncbi:MAG: GNAT family N-acetyltransferase [Bacilli bacterium]
MIKLDNINLVNYNPHTQLDVYKELVKTAHLDNFIKEINDRLNRLNSSDKFKFEQAYLVELGKAIVGYLYVTGITNDTVYVEYLILKDYRKKGYAKLLLKEITTYLFANYNLKSINLDIDVSNVGSINTACAAGYISEELENNKLGFIIDNLDYINKRKR